ncbi:MAG: (Fe-S)-binding protein, partial [Pseudomonadota bacterium]
GGTMCPSFQATHEEMHSPRGRSRLLLEMLRGEVITEGWRSEAVKEALDLCLACKGCRSECPTHVDMATYKAEFLAHYYEGRRRPRQAWSMGRIGRWAPVAGALPRLANFFTQTPGLAALAKRIAGIAPQRRIPAFADVPFDRRHRPRRGSRGPVLLWADTFNNYFLPETAAAAAEVLAHAGYEVRLPQLRLCCGRPFYDFGLLDEAKAALRRIMQVLREDIEAGVPVVGLEPACMSVFRDELVNLFPDDGFARRLAAQTHMLADFLVREGYEPPRLEGVRALVHGHCHQKSVFGMEAELALLRKMGVDCVVPDSGCCGMAGAFGFDADKYTLSMAIGERALLPAVRAADANTLVVTNGYSCREQIAHGAARQALHIAEVLRLALRGELTENTSSAPQRDDAVRA